MIPATSDILSGLPGYFYRLKDRIDDLANLDAFHFEFGSQEDAMFQDRRGHRLHVLG
jgi:hypothetical protein